MFNKFVCRRPIDSNYTKKYQSFKLSKKKNEEK